MNSQRTLSGLTVGDFDELLVEDNFSLLGTFKAGTIQATGDVTCGALLASGSVQGASLDVGSGTIQSTGTISGGTLSAPAANVTSVNANNVSVNSGSATINSDGAITGTSLNAGSGAIQTTGALQAGAITGASLNAGSGAIQTTGALTVGSLDAGSGATMRDPDDDVISLKLNQAVTGISSAGLGNIQGGKESQYGIIIDESPTSGTYQKAEAYANAFEAIIPANGGTGWLPLQVKTYNGAEGNMFKVDIDGNTTTALKLSCNNLGVDGDAATISDSGIVTGAKINGPQHNITANSGTIGYGAFTGTTLVGSSHSDKTTATNLKFDSNTNKWGRLDFDDDDTTTFLKGCSYPTKPTVATYLDLTSTTNTLPDSLPDRVYQNGTPYYYQFNSGDWRPNDDSSYFNVNIVDSDSTFRGRAQVDSSSLELVAVLLIPAGWKVTKIKVFASSTVPIDCYRVYNTNSGGSTDMLYGMTTNTNSEYSLSTQVEGDMDFSVMVVVHTNSTSMYVSGGYFVVERVTSGGD